MLDNYPQFINLRPWEGPIVREIEPLSRPDIFFDIRNNTKLILLEKHDHSLEFSFESKPYNREPLDLMNEFRQFKIVFHGTELLRVNPPNFLDFKGDHLSEAFIYTFDQDRAHIRWEGDTDSKAADPFVEFQCNKIEFIDLQQ